MPALNPGLFARLKRQFGSVKISNQGQKMPTPSGTLSAEGTPRLNIIQSGEYYQVSCPYCTDTRHRLYINHMYGKEDIWGRTMTFLAVCYNENCLSSYENRRDFVDTLRADGFDLTNALIEEGKTVNQASVVSWPGDCTRLDRLPADHVARTYLLSRGFDPDLMCKLHGVCFCTDSRYFLVRNRIVIPIFEGDKLKGWQARYVGELAWKGPNKKEGLPPKYFSCPESKFRSMCIYNWDRMKQWTTGVVLEGPTDVWRFGSMSGCIFGNTVTMYQKSKLLGIFKQRSLVLCLDPEEYESRSTQDTISYFHLNMQNRFCAVRLPKGLDPGSMDRDFLKGYVKDEAAAQGVNVVYKLWKK